MNTHQRNVVYKTCLDCGDTYESKVCAGRDVRCSGCKASHKAAKRLSLLVPEDKKHVKLTSDQMKANARDRHYLRNYGITLREYNNMLVKQNGVCAICEQSCTKELAVDHDHCTGKVRGLLCKNCNLGLGHFLDNTSYLNSAIKYLEAK